MDPTPSRLEATDNGQIVGRYFVCFECKSGCDSRTSALSALNRPSEKGVVDARLGKNTLGIDTTIDSIRYFSGIVRIDTYRYLIDSYP